MDNMGQKDMRVYERFICGGRKLYQPRQSRKCRRVDIILMMQFFQKSSIATASSHCSESALSCVLTERFP